MSTKIFNMKVVMKDQLDSYQEEDIVKNIWPGMYVFLTRRKGVNNGTITLENGSIEITWNYEDSWCGDGYCENEQGNLAYDE